MGAKLENNGKRVDLDAFADMDRTMLVERWMAIYGVLPPKGVKRGLLERAIAYHSQTRPGERLQSSHRKQLLQIAQGKLETVAPRKADELKPGARLVREWRGVTHQVDVIEAGFIWRGEVYKTLSAVAGAITGAHRSGPRFFGLC